MGGVVGGVLALFGVWGWSGDGPPARNLLVVLALATVYVVAMVALVAAVALSTARVDGNDLCFAFCGVTYRKIPLASIHGYDRPLAPRLAVRILCGSSWYVSTGLLDQDQLAALLRSSGVAEKDAA